MIREWKFDVDAAAAVVTTSYVTEHSLPILYVVHEHDDEEGVIWQFHADNGDYSSEVLQLVRLDEVLAIDPTLEELAQLPLGHAARREGPEDEWTVSRAE